MYYRTAEQVPCYFALGQVFPVSDRFFCSVMAQTYPNRRFLIAGSEFGLVDNPLPPPADPDPRPSGFGTVFDMLNAFGITGLAAAPLPTGASACVAADRPGLTFRA